MAPANRSKPLIASTATQLAILGAAISPTTGTFAMSGGLSLGGSAYLPTGLVMTGGLALGGAARFFPTLPMTGGLALGGAARFFPTLPMTGGLALGGAARFPLPFYASGGLDLGGAAGMGPKIQSVVLLGTSSVTDVDSVALAPPTVPAVGETMLWAVYTPVTDAVYTGPELVTRLGGFTWFDGVADRFLSFWTLLLDSGDTGTGFFLNPTGGEEISVCASQWQSAGAPVLYHGASGGDNAPTISGLGGYALGSALATLLWFFDGPLVSPGQTWTVDEVSHGPTSTLSLYAREFAPLPADDPQTWSLQVAVPWGLLAAYLPPA